MTTERLAVCPHVIRWNGATLAEALDVPLPVAGQWLAGTDLLPPKAATWIEALCSVHEAAESSKPATAGARHRSISRAAAVLIARPPGRAHAPSERRADFSTMLGAEMICYDSTLSYSSIWEMREGVHDNPGCNGVVILHRNISRTCRSGAYS